MNRLLNRTSLLLFLYTLFFAALSYFYLQKISAFGCFDDCNNMLGGYFLLNNKQIFSDFFFNHAPGMAYISFLVQKLTEPSGLYELVLNHRLALFAFSFLSGIFLIIRFKTVAFLFLLAFESTKYFIFGDRFLAEGFVVYLIVYLFGLVLLKYSSKILGKTDFYLSAIFAWVIIFTREPYIPLIFLLLLFILIGKIEKAKIASLFLFSALSTFTIVMLPLREMFENVLIYNNQITSSELIEKGGPIKVALISLIHPVYVFYSGIQSIFRIIEQVISGVFIITVLFYIKNKNYKLVVVIIILLGASNIRFVVPGEMFYGSFHMIIWYAMLIYSAFYLIINSGLKSEYRKILISIILFTTLFSLTSKESFTNRSNDSHNEFSQNYNNYYVYGTAIKTLSSPTHSLFLEERDDLIYIVANRPSSYKYQWYTSLMPVVPKFKEERNKMWEENPPDFYVDTCLLLARKESDPANYVRLNIYQKPSCLLIRNDIYKQIPDMKWKSIAPLGLTQP